MAPPDVPVSAGAAADPHQIARNSNVFYSRPEIEPLGWDLVDLPSPNGSRNFDGLTSDRRPIDFRFSSGWLTVERGDAGAHPDGAMEEILSVPISPFGVMDIYPEQLCDILGLTVKGRRVDLSRLTPQSRGFDWAETDALLSRLCPPLFPVRNPQGQKHSDDEYPQQQMGNRQAVGRPFARRIDERLGHGAQWYQ